MKHETKKEQGQKIKIVNKKISEINDGDHVLLYNTDKKITYIKKVTRKKTLIHRHKYIVVDYGGEYSTDNQRSYDYEKHTFDVIVVSW